MEECVGIDQDILHEVIIPTLNVDRMVQGKVDPEEQSGTSDGGERDQRILHLPFVYHFYQFIMKNSIILDPFPQTWVLVKEVVKTCVKIVKAKIKKIWNNYQ